MASFTKLSLLLGIVTVLIGILLPAKTIQQYRIQLQQYSIELYADLKQFSDESPKRVNSHNE